MNQCRRDTDAVEYIADIVEHGGRNLGHANTVGCFQQLTIDRRELGFGPLPLGHIAKTPDPSDAGAAQSLGLRISLKKLSVLQLEHVKAIELRILVEIMDFL